MVRIRKIPPGYPRRPASRIGARSTPVKLAKASSYREVNILEFHPSQVRALFPHITNDYVKGMIRAEIQRIYLVEQKHIRQRDIKPKYPNLFEWAKVYPNWHMAVEDAGFDYLEVQHEVKKMEDLARKALETPSIPPQ